jgi:hypothetical protein
MQTAKLAALALLALAAPAAAEEPAGSLTRQASSAPSLPWIGAGADVGVPDGATVSIVYRPIRQLRAQLGVSHNLISLGERAGLTYVPFASWFTPTLSLEYGHYAEGNANPLYKRFAGSDASDRPVLQRIGYDYASARIGLELGRKWFTFYLHAGVSRITGTVHNLDAETMSESSGTTTVSFPSDPNVKVWTASARLGFIVYLAK